MKYCYKCGNEIPDDSMFCLFCGTRVPDDCSHENNESSEEKTMQRSRSSSLDYRPLSILKLVVIAVIIVVAILVTKNFGGMNKSNGKSEREIVKDIQSRDSFFTSYNLKVDSSRITKRQTNPEYKTDYVYIDIVALNEEFIYDASYRLTYELYNNGWILERYNRENWSYKANNHAMINDDEVDGMIAAYGYDDWRMVDKKEGDKTVDYVYEASKYEYCFYSEYKITVSYNYYPGNSWGEPHISTDITYSRPDIIGRWVLHDGEHNYEVEVLDADFVKNTARVKYKFGTKNVLESNGIVTLDIGYYSDKDVFMTIPNTLGSYPSEYTIWAHVGDITTLTEGGEGYGVAFEGWWLYREEDTTEAITTEMTGWKVAKETTEYYVNGKKNIYEYKYDENGNTVEKKYLSYENDSKDVFGSITRYEYDELNNIVKEDFIDIDTYSVLSTTYNKYDEKRNLIERETLQDGSEVLHEYCVNEYNGNDDLIKTTMYDENHELVELNEMEYDDKGNIIKKTWVNMVENETYTEKYSYDNKSRLLSTSTEEKGIIHENMYDDAGRLIYQRIDGSEREFKYYCNEQTGQVESMETIVDGIRVNITYYEYVFFN